jgi:hypothetical protein
LSERKKARKKERKENKNKNYFLDSGILLLLQKLLYKIGKSFSFFFAFLQTLEKLAKIVLGFLKKIQNLFISFLSCEASSRNR